MRPSARRTGRGCVALRAASVSGRWGGSWQTGRPLAVDGIEVGDGRNFIEKSASHRDRRQQLYFGPISQTADLWIHPRSGRLIQDRSGVTAQGRRTDRPSWGSYPGDRTPKTGMLNRRRALSPHPKDRPAIAWVRDPTRAIRPAPLSCDPRSVGQIVGGSTGQRFYLMVIHRSGIQISDRRAIGQHRSGVQVADFTPDLQLHRDLGTPDLAALSS